ncbi:MAG: xylulokinase [Phycisphaerae bacterium]|nr:xylulokinase [Phycisphaerae bacterium]
MANLLGIDVGTSGTKAIIVGDDGEILGTGTGHHEPLTPCGGWSEQTPDDWWQSTKMAIAHACGDAGLNPHAIDGIGLTGQMHGLVALDHRMTPIRPAILWNDGRCEPQCHEVEDRLGIERLVALTGNRMLPGFTAPKLLWMREHEPAAFERITTVLLPKDWIRWKLSGVVAMDVSDASGTAVFDCENRRWSEELLNELDLPTSWWPDAAESATVLGMVTASAAEATGLQAGTPIVAGAGDQAASAVGTGLVREGTIGAALGTSGVTFAPSDRWRSTPDGSLHAFCHAVPDRWHLMGVMLSGAGSLDWFRSAFMPELGSGDDAFRKLETLATTAPPGSDGLLFLPYLSGERTPHPDANARGAFIGLDRRHERRHLARAVFEGVTHGLTDCLNLVRGTGLRTDVVRLSGGGMKSALWKQSCADLFGTPVATTTTTEGTAFGAAILAATGIGRFEDVPTACDAWIRETERIEPGPDAELLKSRHAVYEDLYPALKDLFPRIAENLETER